MGDGKGGMGDGKGGMGDGKGSDCAVGPTRRHARSSMDADKMYTSPFVIGVSGMVGVVVGAVATVVVKSMRRAEVKV